MKSENVATLIVLLFFAIYIPSILVFQIMGVDRSFVDFFTLFSVVVLIIVLVGFFVHSAIQAFKSDFTLPSPEEFNKLKEEIIHREIQELKKEFEKLKKKALKKNKKKRKINP